MGIFTSWRQRKLRKALLFSFWDGRRNRHVDGLRLFRSFRRKKEFSDPELLDSLQKDDPDAMEHYLATWAEILEVQRYNPETQSGLTDGELLQLACRFAEWVSKKKAWGLL